MEAQKKVMTGVVVSDKMDKTDAEYFVKNAIKEYSKKIDEERLKDERTTIND